MKMEVDELISRIRDYTKKSVKESRFNHSVRTAELASKMGRLYHVDDIRYYIAGLAHDMCKSLSDSEMLKVSSRDGRAISTEEAENPSLLHGRAAAVLLQELFTVTDAEILQAVAMHTLGGRHLCPLAKIIFVADKIEPGRPHSSPEYVDELLKLSLDELSKKVVEENIEYLHSKGKKEASISREFLEELKAELDGI
ncbi:MAG: bis(5'-nucleosyl)-tetraphosphatase (symmetrical) YqeK [Treponema sp.]|nr:bis(5'-nucleosyl)-tetraphosphatase (symmetrical) YqeK [Treponema sp.]